MGRPHVNDSDLLATRFADHRARLRALAFRMLGSASEADDALQEAWLRLSRADGGAIADLEGWLITVVARVCLDALRARRRRRDDPRPDRLPEPLVSTDQGLDPEQAALLGDAVGLAMLVVLDTLGPAERVAFVLHDVFDVPFDDIAPIIGRTPTASRQLASRARRRVRGVPMPDADLSRQRTVVEAFYAAAREGDFAKLVEMLDPDAVLRVDRGAAGGGIQVGRGARAIAEGTLAFAQFTIYSRPALVNGAVGMVAAHAGRTYAIAAITVRDGRIAEIDILADPARLDQIDLSFPE
jgi:RNA polymerase sigma-70 factor, ECF subfamily